VDESTKRGICGKIFGRIFDCIGPDLFALGIILLAFVVVLPTVTYFMATGIANENASLRSEIIIKQQLLMDELAKSGVEVKNVEIYRDSSTFVPGCATLADDTHWMINVASPKERVQVRICPPADTANSSYVRAISTDGSVGYFQFDKKYWPRFSHDAPVDRKFCIF
jgi:hypothetical protein